MPFLFVALGLIILILAGDALVRGAANLSLRLGISALVVSLTVVAFGTSAPELLVSVQAVLTGAPGIAIGNVVGSNIANVLLVLGVPAIISGLPAADRDSRASYYMMVAATVLFIAILSVGPVRFPHGLTLVAALSVVLFVQFRMAHAHKHAAGTPKTRVAGTKPTMSWPRIFLYLAVGLIGLPLGADLLIDSAVVIAQNFGISDTVIGLTLVAVGTSLPELATTVMAAIRKEADIAMGNVIGSNLFNLLAIIGIAGLIAPVPVDPAILRFDVWVMLASALLLGPFVLRGQALDRRWGIVMCMLYIAYLWAVV